MSSRQATLFDAEPDPWQLDAAHEVLAACVAFTEQPWGPYDYAVPANLAAKLKPGQRVQVPLGKGNRNVVGYCTAIANKPVGRRPLKPIGRVVDEQPLLSPAMLRLAAWMADYYLCTLGEVTVRVPTDPGFPVLRNFMSIRNSPAFSGITTSPPPATIV